MSRRWTAGTRAGSPAGSVSSAPHHRPASRSVPARCPTSAHQGCGCVLARSEELVDDAVGAGPSDGQGRPGPPSGCGRCVRPGDSGYELPCAMFFPPLCSRRAPGSAPGKPARVRFERHRAGRHSSDDDAAFAGHRDVPELPGVVAPRRVVAEQDEHARRGGPRAAVTRRSRRRSGRGADLGCAAQPRPRCGHRPGRSCVPGRCRTPALARTVSPTRPRDSAHRRVLETGGRDDGSRNRVAREGRGRLPYLRPTQLQGGHHAPRREARDVLLSRAANAVGGSL